MITLLKRHQIARTFLVLAIAALTLLILLSGSLLLHSSGLQPVAFAHAATTCASTNGTQQQVCEQQDPIAQGCAQDARSIEVESVYTAQNALIGEVDLRHSARCHTFWIRTMAYANATQVQAIEAIAVFHSGKREDVKKTLLSQRQEAIVFTNMVFVQPGPLVLKWAGKFFLEGQTPPITIPI